MYKISDIPKYTSRASWSVNVSWQFLEEHIESHGDRNYILDFDPDFQRVHVWTEAQQIRYVEFILRGGNSGKDLYFNCVGWQMDYEGPYVLVDGKQRLEAVRKFMRNELPVFNSGFLGNKEPLLLKDFSDKPRIMDTYFNWHVNNLKTRKEVLQWYLDLNAGGIAHTEQELDKVRKLLELEK